MLWIGFTLAATVLATAGQLVIKGATGSPLLLACILGMTTGSFGLLGLVTNVEKARALPPRSIAAVVIAGTIFFVANILWLHAIQRTPNLALVRGIMAGTEIVILAVLAYLVYRQKLTKKQFAGIALIAAGIALSTQPAGTGTAVAAGPTTTLP